MATRGQLKQRKTKEKQSTKSEKPKATARSGWSGANSTKAMMQTGRRPASGGPPPVRAELAKASASTSPKPKAKAKSSDASSQPRPSSSSSPSSKSSSGDLRSWAAKEQAKLKSDQAARKSSSSGTNARSRKKPKAKSRGGFSDYLGLPG